MGKPYVLKGISYSLFYQIKFINSISKLYSDSRIFDLQTLVEFNKISENELLDIIIMYFKDGSLNLESYIDKSQTVLARNKWRDRRG